VTSSPPSSSAKEQKKALGSRMREVRKDAGLSARELALLTGQHFTRVSKIENGTQVPTGKDIRSWCQACDAEEQVPDLIATARAVESAYVEFRRQARAGLKRVTGPHTMERYTGTTTFRIYEHNAVPGLFQTAAYCESMLSFWAEFLETGDRLQAVVADRMRKQEVIGWRGKAFRVVLEEQALRTWFGTAEVHAGQLGRLLEVMIDEEALTLRGAPEVMASQVRHLLELAGSPHATVRVIPAGAPIWEKRCSNFDILSFAGTTDRISVCYYPILGAEIVHSDIYPAWAHIENTAAASLEESMAVLERHLAALS